MLDHETRTAILRLHREGHGLRKIARALSVSRNAVRRVLRSGTADVPRLERPDQLGEHLERVRELYIACEGNLVRVAEELEGAGITVGYSTLTAFCRRLDIGTQPRKPAGRYSFEPGEEMQHDTSPHRVKIAGKVLRLECASLILCFSRMLYVQCYSRWSRFECRAFLSEAIQYFGGAAARCMIDNSSVIRAHGTGKDMVPAATMAALAKRFQFSFAAHEVGHADRSARVERNFHYIETNAYPGRTFESVPDLNRQLVEWCDKVNRRPRRLHGEVKAVPMELFAAERMVLRPLPLHIPEVYDLHSRRVDVEGYITLHRNRYSVPLSLPGRPWLIGKRFEVRESLETVRVVDGHEVIAEHARLEPGLGRRVTLPEHRKQGRRKKEPPEPSSQERALRAAAPELGELVAKLRRRHGGQALRAVRRLYRLFVDYPTSCLVEAVRTALHFRLYDIGRIERMTLERIRGDFFRLPPADGHDDTEG